MRQCFEEEGWMENVGDPIGDPGQRPTQAVLENEEILLLEVMDKITQLQQELRTMQQENRDFLSRVIDSMAELLKA